MLVPQHSRVLRVLLIVIPLLVAPAILYPVIELRNDPFANPAPERAVAQLAVHTASIVERYLRRLVVDLEVLAAIPAIRERLRLYATPIDVIEVNRLDAGWKGMDAEAKRKLLDPALSQFLESIEQQPRSVYKELLLADGKGRVIAASRPTDDYYQADEYWWPATDAVLSRCRDPREICGILGRMRLFDQSAGAPGLELAVPVFDNASRGKPVGGLKALVNLRELADVLDAARADRRYDVGVLDLEEGTFLRSDGLAPEPDKAFGEADVKQKLADLATGRTSVRLPVPRSENGLTRLVFAQSLSPQFRLPNWAIIVGRTLPPLWPTVVLLGGVGVLFVICAYGVGSRVFGPERNDAQPTTSTPSLPAEGE